MYCARKGTSQPSKRSTAKEYALGPDSPYVFYYNQLLTKMRKHNRVELFKTYREQPDDEVTLEDVCNKLIIWGTPDKVADEIIEFQEEVGEFGTILYAGKDWASPDLAKRSMVLAAEKVMPVVTSATNESRKNKTAAE